MLEIENTRLVGGGPEDVDMDVRYPVEPGEVLFRGCKTPVDVSSDEIRSVDRNVVETSAVPHEPRQFSPLGYLPSSEVPIGLSAALTVAFGTKEYRDRFGWRRCGDRMEIVWREL